MQNSTVDGFDDLFKTMDALSDEIGKGKTDRIWKKAMGYAIEPVYDQAKENAPRKTGQLAAHVYMKVQRPQARDKSSASYQGEMFMARVTVSPKRDDSTSHTTITKKGKERTQWNHRPVALAMEFGTAEDAPKPFLRGALERNISNVVDRLGKAVWYEISWGKWAQGKRK